MSAPQAFSQRLLQCLINLDVPGERSEAKMELMLVVNELMPGGKPDLLGVRKYEPIREMIQHEGKRKVLALLVILVKDFCSSLNIVRNMNEDQMIETAAMLLEECGNFRMEDYVQMFAMAKKGDLVKIYDRIDIQVVTEIMDEYWHRRRQAGEAALNREVALIEGLEHVNDRQPLIFDDKKGYMPGETLSQKIAKVGGAVEMVRQKLTAMMKENDTESLNNK